MEHIAQGYRGFTLLIDLNWDRLLYGATIAVALGIGGYLGSVVM